MVGHIPLEDVILVRVQASQPCLKSAIRERNLDFSIIILYVITKI